MPQGPGIDLPLMSEPYRPLNSASTVSCWCGYRRYCGYMDITAQHLADVHSKRPGHAAEVTSQAAPLLTRATMKGKVARTRRKSSRGMMKAKLPGKPGPLAGRK